MTDWVTEPASRRRFLKAVPVAMSSAVALPALASESPTISPETLSCAETVAGVSFSPAEHTLMEPLVAANREHYDTLRRVAIGYDVEPAFSFHPFTKNSRPSGPATRNATLPLSSAALTRPDADTLAFASLADLARLVAARHLTSRELTDLYLERLKRFGPRLECVVTLTEDLARAQAAEADREIAAGRYRGPLHGIPYGIKDLFATKHIRTTWGAKPFADQVPEIDATVVERMREAGAVLVAKLTSGELAIGDVWFGGKTRNPWDPSKGSSGSSAGPASATAAGLVGFAIGTETGGSIISPAHTCGVVGLRPTYGRISRYGCMTLRWTMDKVGPIARSVEDCALVLNALYGPDGRDRSVEDVAFPWTGARALGSLSIGIVEEEFSKPPDDDEERRGWERQKAVLAGALATLEGAGARLTPIALPSMPARAMYAILNAEAGAAFDDLIRAGGVNELAGKGPNDRANQLRVSRLIPAVEYIRAQRARTLLGEQLDAVMSTVDLFVTPSTSPSVTMANLTGHPGVTVNAGLAGGLPVGLMFTGRLYDEAALLGAALRYEQTRGALPTPRLSS